MTVEELPEYLKAHWLEIRERLLAETYRPSPVRRVTIAKAGGGERELGIPTVLDRFIQQSILQVLTPEVDPTFSEHNYGFRPGRSAHQAVRAAQEYIQQGRRWVVDVDLEKFFDRVQHDALMARVAKRVEDKRLLRLIRHYLEAGVMGRGVVVERHEGTPQGGPLSPLLANILLDEVDKELERRGHAFCRYADDCNVYVRSKRAAERVMQHLKKVYAGLQLRINESKSAVGLARERPFLGYSFWVAAGGRVCPRMANKSRQNFKHRIRQCTSRMRGRSVSRVVSELRSFLIGWKNYFRLDEGRGVWERLDKWIRHRLRVLHLKQWKRGTTAYRALRAMGVSDALAAQTAGHRGSWWKMSHKGAIHHTLPVAYFDRLGLPRLAA